MAASSPPPVAADAGAPAPGSRTTLRTAVVWDYLRDALAELAAGRALEVLDVGGGSGGFAVPLAQIGHRVTVVDPSPDSLAALERRAAETSTTGAITALQGDAAGVLDLVGAESYDAVLCHSVLEVVDEPAEAMDSLARTLRSGGLASVLAANRVAAVLARASVGRVAEARHVLDDAAGRSGAADPLARRFDLDQLVSLLTTAGLRPRTVHGVRVFADSVPAAVLDADAHTVDELLALERAVAERRDYLALATQLHVIADRG
jgi:SAM-dependent methyltransferase